MTLRKHLRYSALVGAAVALPLAVLILWVQIHENSQLEFYDTGRRSLLVYIILRFASSFVWFQVVGMATYWIFVLLGRAVDAWAAPRGPRNDA